MDVDTYRRLRAEARRHARRAADADDLVQDALQFGLIRRALKAALRGADGMGTHDADGHLIVLRTAVRGDAHTSTGGGNP